MFIYRIVYCFCSCTQLPTDFLAEHTQELKLSAGALFFQIYKNPWLTGAINEMCCCFEGLQNLKGILLCSRAVETQSA